MKRRIFWSLIAMSLLLTGCKSQSMIDQTTQTPSESDFSSEKKETQKNLIDTEIQDEIQLLSLECVPELSLARLTAKITTDKSKDIIQKYYPNYIYGQSKITKTEEGYLMSWVGSYDVSQQELEAIDALYYNGKELKDAVFQTENMQVETFDTTKFEAKDAEKNIFQISISKLGFKITYDLEKMDKKRYFVAELKDGGEAILWQIPTITFGKKMKSSKVPDKISELEDNDAYIGTECGGTEDAKNGSATIYSQSDIDETNVASIHIYE